MNTALSKKTLINELGTSGTTIVNGFIEEDYRSDLQGRDGCTIYDQMRKSDAQVFATLLACELPIRSTEWGIKPGTNKNGEIDEKCKEIADFVEYNLFEALENTFDDLLREILTMLPFGFSVFEKVYGLDEQGQIILKKLWSRKQTSIHRWQTSTGSPGIVQLVPAGVDDATDASKKNSNIDIPLEKLVIFSFRKEGKNYEGTSILRSAYKHWYIKDKLYKFDAVRHERQSVGIPIIYLPKSASEDDKLEAARIVRNVRSTEQTGIVMPGPKDDGWLFEFADTKGDSGTDLFESIKHHNREIAKNVLAQFLELGDTTSGSRSLGEDQSKLFLLSLAAVAKQIKDTFNKNVIQELVDLNYDIGEYSYPEFEFEKLGDVDYKTLVDNVVALTWAGLVQPDEELEDYIRESLGLPEKTVVAREKSKPDPMNLQSQIDELKRNSATVNSEKKKVQDQIKKGFNEIKDEILEKTKHTCNDGCSHENDGIFNDTYFQELSNLIDRKFIIDSHLENEIPS